MLDDGFSYAHVLYYFSMLDDGYIYAHEFVEIKRDRRNSKLCGMQHLAAFWTFMLFAWHFEFELRNTFSF